MKLAELDFLDIWRSLGGETLRGKRAKAFWRDGDGYNIALDPVKGAWYDHRDGHGGGVLTLVETALGCNRRAALQWLEANWGLSPRRSLSVAERRDHRQERDGAENFGIAARALAEEMLERLHPCDLRRVIYTQLMDITHRGGSALVDEYWRWLGTNPELTRAMVRTGVSSQTRSQRRLAFYLLDVANAA